MLQAMQEFSFGVPDFELEEVSSRPIELAQLFSLFNEDTKKCCEFLEQFLAQLQYCSAHTELAEPKLASLMWKNLRLSAETAKANKITALAAKMEANPDSRAHKAQIRKEIPIIHNFISGVMRF